MKFFTPSLLLVLLIFASCKKQTTYVKQIENNSIYPFTVTYFNAIAQKQETHVIDAHQATVFFIQTLDGANTSADKCLADVRDLEIITQDNLLFVLDPLNEQNWTVSVSENKSNVRQTCIMSVDNVDFVPE